MTSILPPAAQAHQDAIAADASAKADLASSLQGRAAATAARIAIVRAIAHGEPRGAELDDADGAVKSAMLGVEIAEARVTDATLKRNQAEIAHLAENADATTQKIVELVAVRLEKAKALDDLLAAARQGYEALRAAGAECVKANALRDAHNDQIRARSLTNPVLAAMHDSVRPRVRARDNFHVGDMQILVHDVRNRVNFHGSFTNRVGA